MIPVKLAMRNFMCYGDQVSTLDFSGIHLACLSGDNGHGKSAIIDAMTWALWGKARTQRDDDLIHLGSTHMEVTLSSCWLTTTIESFGNGRGMGPKGARHWSSRFWITVSFAP